MKQSPSRSWLPASLALAGLLSIGCGSSREQLAEPPRTLTQGDAEGVPATQPSDVPDAASPDSAHDLADASAPPGQSASTTSLRAQICGTQARWPAPLPEVSQRTAKRVGSEKFGFVEGPVWVAEQNALFFSDMDFAGGNEKGPPSRIHKLTPPARFEVLVAASGSNGIALAPNGSLLAATHDTQSLAYFDPQRGTRSDLAITFEGKRLNSPNDLAIRSDGTVYFSDPDWQLGARAAAIGSTGVYRVGPRLEPGRAIAASSVDATLDKPNGVALSPDERTLYVGSNGEEIYQYPVAEDGSLGARKLFARTGPSDGMTVDCAGNVYVASGTVEVFAASGAKLGEIKVPESPTNAAFGGADRKTLYITAETGLYAISLNVPGFPH